MTKRVAVVVQRYGSSIIGGAETHARLIVERVLVPLGYDVDVYTSRSHSYLRWENAADLPDFEPVNKGVRIFRFKTQHERQPIKMKVIAGLLRFLSCEKLGETRGLSTIRGWLERGWIAAQGPFVPGLIKTLKERESDYTSVVFFSYLYFPTVAGLLNGFHRTILIPTAHDEFPLYFSLVRKAVEKANVIFCNSSAESALLQKVMPGGVKDKIVEVGVGVETAEFPAPQKWSAREPLRLLYLGRIGPGKGIPQVIAALDQIMERTLMVKPFRLHLAGRLDEGFELPERKWLQHLGILNEKQKVEAFEWCDVGIVPSAWESLSLFTLELLTCHKPVIVNSNSSVLASYQERYPTVYGYKTATDLAMALEEILVDARKEPFESDLSSAAVDVREYYSWDRIRRVYARELAVSMESKENALQ